VTDADLYYLIMTRNNALARLDTYAIGRQFRAADAAITAELWDRDRPVTIGEITYHLTSDRLNFVALNSNGKPAYGPRTSRGECSLFDYDAKLRKAHAKS
jgi:hypothetical protein